MTTPTQSDEQRVKEPIDIPCPRCQAKAGQECFEDQFGVYQHTFHNARIDAASRLPKATTDHEFVWRADSEQCSVCGENHHGCIIVKQPSVSPVDEGEAPPQTFKEWWRTEGDHLKWFTEPFKTFARFGWNAAKASSPATVPRDIAHTLWNEGGRLRTELAASLGVHPENWHKEGLQQRIAEWDKVAERYFDYALSGPSSSPAVDGGESEYAQGFNDCRERAMRIVDESEGYLSQIEALRPPTNGANNG